MVVPFVSIIIPTYNEERHITGCLDSVLKVDYPRDRFEVIVVDNGSQDKTQEVAKKFPVKLFIEKRRGPSYTRNLGISKSKGDILVFLDADCVVSKSWLIKLVGDFKLHDIGGVGGAIYPITKTIISRYLGFSLFMKCPASRNKKNIRGAYPTGNLAVRKELLIKAGGFEERGGLHDKDMGIRLQRQGYRFVYEPEAIVYHHNPTTFLTLVKIWWRSAANRVPLSKKYPYRMESIFFKLYFTIFYLIAIVISFSLKYFLCFGILILSPILILLVGAVNAFRESKDFFLSFIVKPALDSLSIFVISIGFFYYNYIRRNRLKKTYLDLLEMEK